jgi:hypothetical protein
MADDPSKPAPAAQPGERPVVDLAAGLTLKPEAALLEAARALMPPGMLPPQSLEDLGHLLGDGVRYSALIYGLPSAYAERERIVLEVVNALPPGGAPAISTLGDLKHTLDDAYALYKIRDGLAPISTLLDAFRAIAPADRWATMAADLFNYVQSLGKTEESPEKPPAPAVLQ